MRGHGALFGALCGLVAGLVTAGFFSLAGEPRIEEAIAIEVAAGSAVEGHTHGHQSERVESAGEDEDASEEWVVSRGVQKGIGLFGGLGLIGTALGALFGALHASLRGDPFRRAVGLGVAFFTSLHLVPWFKYPPNPPAVGDPDTIGARQAWFALLVVGSLASWVAAFEVRRRLSTRARPQLPTWLVDLSTLAVFAIPVISMWWLFPSNPDPVEIPARLAWQFRTVSLAGNALLWAVIALGFGVPASIREDRARVDVDLRRPTAETPTL